MATSRKSVAQKTNNLPAGFDVKGMVGVGFENADSDAFAIPFIVVLQSGSPQCKRSDGRYVKGAQEGMLFNTVTQEIFDGDKGIELIPCAYSRVFIEWRPREAEGGGALVGIHDEPQEMVGEDAKGMKINAAGNHVNDTRQHFCLMKHPATGSHSPVVVAMARTSIKKSRNWMAQQNENRFTAEEAKEYGIPEGALKPSFWNYYRLTTIPQQKNENSWFIYNATKGEQVPFEIMNIAKEFNAQVNSGKVRAKHEDLDSSGAEETDSNSDDF